MDTGIDAKNGFHALGDQDEEMTINRILTRFDVLRSMRSNYESVWDEITDYVLPSRGSYSQLNTNTPAQRRDRKILDITGIVAARTLAARVITEMTSPNERWFNLTIQDAVVQQDEEVRRFLYEVSERIFDTLSKGWQLPHIEVTTDWIAYGTACLFVQSVKDEDSKRKELVFKSIPITELFIAENFKGKPDTVFRYFKLPIRQIAQEFGTEKFSRDLLVTLQKDPDQLFEVIHAVYPSDTYVVGGKMKKTMKYKSCYVMKDSKILLSEGGFKEMPFIVFRFWKRTGEPYGGSPAWDALSDIRMINVMSETALRSFQMEAFPPLLAASDGVIMPLKTMPNGVNIGGMSPEGKRLIEPLVTGTKTQLAFEVLEQRRQAIRNAFFVDPLINRENSIRTAAEVQKRASEELNGIGPFVRRYEQEYLEPLLDRVIDFVLEEYYTEETIPEALQGLETKIDYTAPMAKTHKAKQLDSTMSFLQMLQLLAQSDPSILGVIKKENLVGLVTELLGVPYYVLKSQEELQAEQQAAQQQQMMEQMLQAGPALAQTAEGTSNAMKNLAQTAQVGLGGQGTLNVR
jgi:hypothetical protein